MKTYGTLTWHPKGPMASGFVLPTPTWSLTCEPHVMMRVKRIFARIQQNRSGTVFITDSLDVGRDLAWLIERYPLAMDKNTTDRLAGQARKHRAQVETVMQILGGQHHIDYPLEPARPAREYQLIAADLAIATGRLLVTDDVGLGKSMTGVLVLRGKQALPALVVTLTHLPEQWCGEISKTFPTLRTHVLTSTKPYDVHAKAGGPVDVIVTSYSKLAQWADHLAGEIKTVIFDEAQELRRGDSLKYTAAAQIADHALFKVGLTASPVYNYGGEIHNVLQVLAPGSLGTREEFVREWGAGYYQGDFSKARVQDPGALGAYLRDQALIIGRTRKEVGRELPEVVRVTQPVHADPAVYEREVGNAAELARIVLHGADRKERWEAAGQLDWRMRQATGLSKAPYVADFVRLLLESEERVVLFGWHRAVYDVWHGRLLDFNPVFYTGTESPAQKARAAERFLTGDSRVLCMSLRAGAGLDGLQDAAHVTVFGELDWSPQVHMQCIGRVHRDGQGEPVVAYFLLSDQGSDLVMAQVLHEKRNQSEPMLTKDRQLFEVATDNGDRIKQLATAVLERHAGAA